LIITVLLWLIADCFDYQLLLLDPVVID